MNETMNDSHPHTPDLIFTAAVAAAQRAAADSVAAAVLAAERRGYERGLAEAAQHSRTESARLADDKFAEIQRAISRLEGAIESLANYDPSGDVEIDTSSCEEVEVPSTGDSLDEIFSHCETYGGHTLLPREEVEIDTDAIADAITSRCADLRRALHGVRDLLT